MQVLTADYPTTDVGAELDALLLEDVEQPDGEIIGAPRDDESWRPEAQKQLSLSHLSLMFMYITHRRENNGAPRSLDASARVRAHLHLWGCDLEVPHMPGR